MVRKIIFILFLIFSKILVAEEIIEEDVPYEPKAWVLVDTARQRVSVMYQDQTIKVFNGASFGRGGVGQKKVRGDKVTPRGIYKIGWYHPVSQFRHFLGLTYPNIHDANVAILNKRISMSEYNLIVKAYEEKKLPPQNTRLGGEVGIHGLGNRDLERHRTENWTFGCIALTNKQIDELTKYVEIGATVIII